MEPPWASTSFKNNGWPKSDNFLSLRLSNGGYINTHCFHSGWNPRVIPWANPLLLGGGVYFRQVDGLETERDFYFQKLRDIEIMCQVSGCGGMGFCGSSDVAPVF